MNEINAMKKFIKQNEEYLKNPNPVSFEIAAPLIEKLEFLGIRENGEGHGINDIIKEHYEKMLKDITKKNIKDAPKKLIDLNKYLKAFQAELEKAKLEKAKLEAQKLFTSEQQLQSSSSSPLQITRTPVASYLNRKRSSPQEQVDLPPRASRSPPRANRSPPRANRSPPRANRSPPSSRSSPSRANRTPSRANRSSTSRESA